MERIIKPMDARYLQASLELLEDVLQRGPTRKKVGWCGV